MRMNIIQYILVTQLKVYVLCLTEFICITPRYYIANNYGYCKQCRQKIDLDPKNILRNIKMIVYRRLKEQITYVKN